MIDNISVYNFSIKSNAFKNAFQEEIFKGPQNFFYMKTCQRLIVVSFGLVPSVRTIASKECSRPDILKILKGADAYQYMLEVLCGLQSQMIAENEIVNQFKSAFAIYSQNPLKQKQLTIVLEKLLKDSKEIRTKYLSHITQTGYPSVAKKLFSKSEVNEILIIGTGHLAFDLLHYLKKTHSISFCARNKSKIEEWQNIAPINVVPWIDLHKIANYPIILNTVGVPNYVLADESFFNKWSTLHDDKRRFFIDFGSPSSIIAPKDKTNIYTLDDLFVHGNQLDLEKISKLEHAKRAIEQTVLNRVLWLDQKLQRDDQYTISNSVVKYQQPSYNF